MTKDQAMKIVGRIKHLYSTQARKYTAADWQQMVDTWYEQFKGEDYETVNAALTMYTNRGKQFMPDVADIIRETLNIEEPEYNKLFARLKKECEIVANGIEHIVIDDLGGLRWNDELKREVYYHPETHKTEVYTQSDFANLPKEIQIYAEDIEGLKALHREIASNEQFARRRFIDRMPYIKQEVAEWNG